MSKFCVECYDMFKDDAVASVYKHSPQGVFQECPRRSCRGKVFQIDDTILPTIQMLNMKGYKTYSSCGGHIGEENPEVYIEFDESVRSLPEPPEGFQIRYNLLPGNKKRIVMFSKVEAFDFYDVFSVILEFANELYDWSLELELAEEVAGTTIMIIDPTLMDLFGYGSGEIKKDTPKKEAPKKGELNKDKIKEEHSSGTIKLPSAKTKEKAPEEKPSEESESKTKTGKKRGRPKKEDK